MKSSYYNFLSTCNPDGAILYNANTGCMVRLDQSHYEAFSAFDSQNIEISDKAFTDNLKKCGFLIDNDWSELSQIRYRLLQSRFSSNLLSLVIAPTLECNFRCSYCYEKQQLTNYSMRIETQENIIGFVEQHIEHITDFSVEWYGGEPLLALNTIMFMSKVFLELCAKHHVRYTSNMITNGYLLNEETISILNASNISQVQITLDGSKSTHDQRRKLKNGASTFDTILHNLSLCKQLFNGRIALRVNIDKQNISEIDAVKTLLKEHKLESCVTLYLGKVTNLNDTYDNSRCLKTCEYADRNLAFMLEQNATDNRFLANYPTPIGNSCGADYNLSYVIGPDGLIYKCHLEIGCHDKAIGNINDRNYISKPTLLHSYMLFDPTKDSQCSKCKYLPLCLGGCPKARLSGFRDCTIKKHYLNAYMQYIPQQME